MVRTRIRDLRHAGDEGGWSLVELLVVMSLFAGLLGMVFSVLINVQTKTADNIARQDTVQQAKLALSQIDRQVRSGNVVMDPASETLPRSLRVYTQTNGVRQCVQWQVYNRTLRFRSWDPLGDGTVVNPWQTVARNVVDDATAPTTFTRVTASGGSQAQSVRVDIYLQSSASKGKPVEMSTVLFGRNTVYGYPADVCINIPAP